MAKRDTKKGVVTLMATEFIFSNELSFRDAYPEIEDLCITVTETEGKVKVVFDKSKLRLQNKRVYGTNVGEYIECHSPFCINGGFSIREILRAMVRIREHSKQGTILCRGSEGTMNGSRRYLPCNHSFQFKIAVKYKDEATRSLGVAAYQKKYTNGENQFEVAWFKKLSTDWRKPLVASR